MRFVVFAVLAVLALVFTAGLAYAESPPDASAVAASAPAMPYCSAADVEAKYDAFQIAQRTGDPTGAAIDAGKLNAAVVDFSDLMAPYVRTAYPDVAFGTAEPTLNAIATEGSYLELAKRRPLGMSATEREDYQALFRRLIEIATGRMTLVVPVGQVDPLPAIETADAWRSNARQFGRRAWQPPGQG